MGIAEDKTPLTAANFDTMKNSRKWRTSYLVPFGANIAAVFYRYVYNFLYANASLNMNKMQRVFNF